MPTDSLEQQHYNPWVGVNKNGATSGQVFPVSTLWSIYSSQIVLCDLHPDDDAHMHKFVGMSTWVFSGYSILTVYRLGR
jgi:hypothetical protein